MQESPYWIGVDLHNRVAQVCVLDEGGERVFEKRHTGPKLEEGQEFVKQLAERFPGGRVVVEALGTNRWFVAACREHGFEVQVAHASRLGLKDSGRKTDHRDAYELARRHRLGDIEKNAKSYHPTDEEYGWRQLLRRRHGLVSDRTGYVCQIRALLRNHRVEAPKSDLYEPRNLQKLREIRLENELEQQVLEVLIEVTAAVHAAVKKLADLCGSLTKEHERIRPLLDLPYVGPVTAGTLAAELGDVSRFRNAKAVASYAGLIPRVSQSGDQAFHGPLVRHGNRELRFVLGEWAVQLLNRHPTVQKWAKTRLARMPKNKVRVTLARKLLVGVWHTMRTGEAFCLQRCLATA